MVSQIIKPAVQWYADLFKLDTAEIAADTLTLGIGNAVDFGNNILFGGLGAKVLGFLQGLLAHGVAGYAIVPGQDKDDLRRVGSFLMWQMLDPTPQDLVNLINAIGELKAGVVSGDWARVSRAFGVKSPALITRELSNVGAAFTRAFSLPGTTRTPRQPTTRTPAPAYSTPPVLDHQGVAPTNANRAAIF